MDRAAAVDQLKRTWAILDADLTEAFAYGKRGNTPYAQRALVRAFFAAVEGLSFQLRQVTLASLSGTTLLTDAETQLLQEVKYFLDEKGRPKQSKQPANTC